MTAKNADICTGPIQHGNHFCERLAPWSPVVPSQGEPFLTKWVKLEVPKYGEKREQKLWPNRCDDVNLLHVVVVAVR